MTKLKAGGQIEEMALLFLLKRSTRPHSPLHRIIDSPEGAFFTEIYLEGHEMETNSGEKNPPAMIGEIPLDARILVVDDVGTTRKVLIRMCQDLGFQDFLEAADGEEAWKLIMKSNPKIQLVLCDWYMPGLGGMELIDRAKKQDRFYDMHFIMVTAEADKEEVIKVLKAGVSAYLIKPVSRKSLEEKLRGLKKWKKP